MRASSVRIVVALALLLALAASRHWIHDGPDPTAGSGHSPGPARSSAPTPPTPPPSPAATAPPSAAPSASRLVVALGDSVTAGTACDCSPFPQRYAALLGNRDHVTTTALNLGSAGLTTSSLATQLASPAVRHQLSRASIVVMTIGANDLTGLIDRWAGQGCPTRCSQPVVEAMSRGLARDLAEVRHDTGPGSSVLVTSYWNVFEDGDVADRIRGAGFAGWSDQVTLEADAAICLQARAAADTCVDLYEPFEGADGRRNPTALLAADGDHPNDAGHQAIAEALLAATPPKSF